jgi:glc operon protein GlcG
MSARRQNWTLIVIGLLLVVFASAVAAQALPYGASIGLENAKTVSAAALAEARKNNLLVGVAITDPTGTLVHFERMDGAQYAAFDVATGKARSAALFRRATKAFQEDVTAGGAGLRYLGLPGVVPAEGGIPLVIEGKIVGAIGVSGGTYVQDGQVAAAGAAALK